MLQSTHDWRRSWDIVWLALATVCFCWLAMQWVHEAGHVLSAWLTGGEVERIAMSPIAISRTDLKLNPQPLIVVWGGPLVGVLLPLMLWCASERVWSKGAYLFRFFAGFCLLSNGLYIGLGSFGGIGDCGEMLRHGSSHGQLWLFGGICAPLGLACWNGQGPKFGLGNASRHHAWLLTGLTCLLVILGSFFFPDG